MKFPEDQIKSNFQGLEMMKVDTKFNLYCWQTNIR